jgi:hypothetical protein
MALDFYRHFSIKVSCGRRRDRPNLRAQEPGQVVAFVDEYQPTAAKGGGVIRQGTNPEPGKQTEGTIEQANDCAREVGYGSTRGNGEL